MKEETSILDLVEKLDEVVDEDIQLNNEKVMTTNPDDLRKIDEELRKNRKKIKYLITLLRDRNLM